jgi:hypothetical protein
MSWLRPTPALHPIALASVSSVKWRRAARFAGRSAKPEPSPPYRDKWSRAEGPLAPTSAAMPSKSQSAIQITTPSKSPFGTKAEGSMFWPDTPTASLSTFRQVLPTCWSRETLIGPTSCQPLISSITLSPATTTTFPSMSFQPQGVGSPAAGKSPASPISAPAFRSPCKTAATTRSLELDRMG